MSKRRTPAQMAENAEARVRREQARLKLERIKLSRDAVKARRKMLAVHRAAEVNRFTNDWVAPSTSADSEIVSDLPRVVARGRQMVRDGGWAKSIVRAFRRNVVGTGINPEIENKPYQNAWEFWSEHPQTMDMERRRTFFQVQQWAMSELVIAGQCFVVRWVIGAGENRRLALQCFETEQLDRYKLQDRDTGNEVRAGIEVDDNGAPVAYHFYRQHPHDIRGLARPAPLMLDSVRIPAAMVCHVYDPERVRQSHGISWLRPVLRKLRDLDEYDAAQLRAARAEASIGLLIKGPDTGESLELDGLNVAYIDQEDEVTPFAPQRPGGQYDPFTKAQLKAIAAGVGLSYSQISRDNSDTSYSGGRVGTIEDQREFDPIITLLIIQLCRPVFEDFQFVWAMQNAAQSGDFFLRERPERVGWQGQGWEWVDPEAKGQSVERMLKLGLTSRTIEARKLGRSVTKLDEQRAQDGTDELVEKLLEDADGRELPAPKAAPRTQPQETADASA